MVGILVSLVYLAGSDYFIAVFVDVVERFEQVFRAVLLCIESFEVFVACVEMQAAYRLAVVVVEQDSEIGLRVTVYHAGNIVDFPVQDRSNDVESL